MKTKQRLTAAAANAASVGAVTTTSKQRSKEEEPIRLRQRLAPQTQCERERKHEAARKEREAQAQLKRKSTTTAPSTAMAGSRTRMKTVRITSKEGQQITVKASKAGAKTTSTAETTATKTTTGTATTTKTKSSSTTNDEETAQLRLQLEHLAQLSEQDFEREFRTWMAQEGIEGKVQAQVRMDLINSFNSTSLGKLLRKASASASASSAGAAKQRDRCLLLPPMVLALHTMVAEFLYVQNCHYTLSVFCSELPHRHTLPDFERCQEFRFSQEELQQVINAILGEQKGELQLEFGQTVLRVYDEQQVSLLLGFFKVLVDPTQGRIKEATTNTTTNTITTSTVSTTTHGTEATQTQPAACLPSRPDVDTSKLFQAEELIVAADGRTVFIGPRVSQSLNGVEQQLGQLMHQMRHLCKSCAPPVEIISQSAFEQLLQQELLERQRLLSAGQTLEPGKTALQLPEESQQEKQQQKEQLEGNTVLSPAGPIQLPKESASVPKLPHLHAEQVASLAMVQQALTKLQLQEQMHQSPDCMYVTLERMEALVGELAGCIQTLSNVLNLAMEQEYAVGRHKGYKLGYREGFSHGHFMGVQEGMQSMEQELKQRQQQQEHRQQKKPRQLKDSSSQTAMPPQRPPPASWRSVGCQTPQTRQRHRTTSMERQFQAWRNAASQTTAGQEAPSNRSYEQWIYEMLHSRSGQIFLERVELSLNKALELQKKRLDELFDVKLRHHAEMLRLSNRQSSWRTLCQHVERDSQSMEARDLVHKIFRLLEHYEAHHQLLAEKIQQTEQAARHAAQIEPVWRDAGGTAMGCNVTPASCASKSSPTATGAAIGATAPATIATPFSGRLPGPITAPAPPAAPVPGAYLPSHPPGPVANPALGHLPTTLPTPAAGQLEDPIPSDFPGYLPTSLPASDPSQFQGTLSTPTPVKSPAPSHLQASAADPVPGNFEGNLQGPLPAPVTLPVPGQATSNPSTRLPGLLPAPVPAPTPNTLSVASSVHLPSPAPAPAVTMPTLFTQFLLPLAAGTALATAASSADSPNRPLMLNAATNTQLPSSLILADARPQPVPSFNEALLSARNRMLQLEQESDLLEQSFLGYLERARAQKQKLNCSREHQEFQRTLDSFREWQATTPASVGVPVPASAPAPAPAPVPPPLPAPAPPPLPAPAPPQIVSPIYSGSELEPESYQFTNAIAVARHKLLSELHATTTTQPTKTTLVSGTNRLLVLDQVQDETQELLSRVEATLARVSKPASLQLLAAESQLQLEPLSSGGTHTSLERIATPPASRKLQRSMAKMQLLFGNQTEEQAKAKRPWSAPINKLNASFLPPGRPHTAPSSLTDAVTPAPNLLGLLDALSDVGDSTTNTSSLTSLSLNNHPNPQQLKSSSSGTGSHTSSSATLSPSQEFWKRMNM